MSVGVAETISTAPGAIPFASRYLSVEIDSVRERYPSSRYRPQCRLRCAGRP